MLPVSVWFSQRFLWKGQLTAGTYNLLPFTTGCKLKRMNNKDAPGKPVELVYRTDTGELDLTAELRSVTAEVSIQILNIFLPEVVVVVFFF